MINSTARHLIGRKIVAAECNWFMACPDVPSDRTIAHDWTLTLDNGRRLGFVVEETEIGEYGVDIALSAPRANARQQQRAAAQPEGR